MAERQLEIGELAVIPLAEIRFETARSSGPGGQHVNKTETRVTAVFDVEASRSLSGEQVATLRRRLGRRMSKQGEIRVSSQSSRSQRTNRDEALERLGRLLLAALTPRPKRHRTRPPAAAKRQRLEAKKRLGERKRERGKVDW